MIYRLTAIALFGVAQTIAQTGCLDPLDANFNPSATSDDGVQCIEYCWQSPGNGEPLVTTNAPRNLDGGISGTDLTLAVQGSQMYPLTWLSLISPATSADSPPLKRFHNEFVDHGRASNTPSADWTSSYNTDQCWNDYEFAAEWFSAYLPNDPATSSLVRTDFSDSVLFQGLVGLDSFEDLEDIRDQNLTRWIYSVMPFGIFFHTDATITSGEVDVFDEYNVMYAIIEQKTIVLNATADPPKVEADVVLFSTIQWPYELLRPVISVNSGDLSVAIEMLEDCVDQGLSGASASDNGVQACNQRWMIDVQLLNDICNFDGIYTVDFDIQCAASVPGSECPLSGGETSRVTFDLESEHVCATVVEEVHAVASATSYGTARAGTQPRNPADLASAWVEGDTAFFEIAVNVVDGNDSWIEESIITSIDVCFDVACAAPTPLYVLEPVETFYESSVALNIENYAAPNSPLPTISDFSLVLHEDVFTIPLDSSIVFKLRVGLDVTYTQTSTLLAEGEDVDEITGPFRTTKQEVRHLRVSPAHMTTLEERNSPAGQRASMLRKLRILQDDTTFQAEATGQILPETFPDAGSLADSESESADVGKTSAASGLDASTALRVALTCAVAMCVAVFL